jgi:leucyl aminopeptidase
LKNNQKENNLKFKLIDKDINSIDAECEVIIVVNKDLEHKYIKDSSYFKIVNYTGANESLCHVATEGRIYVGIDDINEHDEIRTATAKVASLLNTLNYKSIKIAIYFDECQKRAIRGMVEGFVLGDYAFDKYKSEKAKHIVEDIYISTENYLEKVIDVKAAKDAISSAKIIADSTNLTRDIVNTMPDDATPKMVAKEAKKIAKKSSVEIKVEDKHFLKDNGMGAFLAVSRASAHDPALIHMTYKPKKAKKKVVFIGKGLTYDSGGLSLKPGSFMTTMKSDKSGACAVLGIMNAVSKMGLDIEVHGIIGACENMIGGDAYKPDDVLVAKDGTTIEVKNTDAEGRLVLADCLCYAQDEVKDFDYIIDLATLTGACVVALGEYTTGVMGHNCSLKHKILRAGEASGELTSTLPFNKYLAKTLKSEIADISNISAGRYGGAITAGLFLDKFIKEENKDKWIHLDIAGPAFVEKAWGYNPHGASGAGVRLAIKFLEQLESNKK